MEIVSGRTLDPLLTAIGMGPPRSQVDKNGDNGWDQKSRVGRGIAHIQN